MTIEITYDGSPVPVHPGETVLDALERAGKSVPSSCRAGACQFCMVKGTGGTIPSNAQQGLKPTLRESGHFLACVCRPVEPLTCVPAHTADFRGYAEIVEINPLGPDVACVRFERPQNYNFQAGQFANFRLDDGTCRSYSMASRSDSNTFDIHVRKIKGGRMSTWFHEAARPRDRVWIEGPRGECTYYPGSPEEPLTLIGTGTGIAPLVAIVEEAVARNHCGPISLYQGAVNEAQLYFVDEIQTLARACSNINYQRYVMNKPSSSDVACGDLKAIAAAELIEPDASRVYLCGDPGLVRALKKKFFLAGVSLNRMHADPFIVAEKNAGSR